MLNLCAMYAWRAHRSTLAVHRDRRCSETAAPLFVRLRVPRQQIRQSQQMRVGKAAVAISEIVIAAVFAGGHRNGANGAWRCQRFVTNG